MTLTHLLADLGERINDDGAATHHLLLQDVAALVADIAPGTASALADASAPDIVRQRALAHASAALLRHTTSSYTAGALGLAA
jgi:hypothetical protein